MVDNIYLVILIWTTIGHEPVKLIKLDLINFHIDVIDKISRCH